MIETDILIIGAGPAGLAAALKLKRGGYAGRVVVLDKARAAGNHVLSGAVIDPAGFEGLLTEREIASLPITNSVNKESFRFLFNAKASVKIPWVPPMMQAEGFPICSLSKVVKYLSNLCEKEGVEIYHGYAVRELIGGEGAAETMGRKFGGEGAAETRRDQRFVTAAPPPPSITGAVTGEKGVDANGGHKRNYLASEEISAKLTILAEGAEGVLTRKLIADYNLAGQRPQVYALGIKELIELPEARPGSGGEIMHTFGYPVDLFTYGGGFVYHVSDNQVMVGYAVGLDYKDAALEPHELFRRFKATSAVAKHIAGGKSVAYGAKLIPEGGFYALPKPYAPGALIVGDGAGLVDGLRIKGIHIAIESGCAAAEAILGGLDGVGERYAKLLKNTTGYREVERVRNVHGGFSYCAPIGVMMAGFAWLTFGKFPWWPVGRVHRDCETLNENGGEGAAETMGRKFGGEGAAETMGRKFGGEGAAVTMGRKFGGEGADRLTDVFLSGTIHDEDQPCHLKIGDKSKCEECAKRFNSPCTRFCPGEVYRREADGSLRIDFSNCLHCKTCEVKCPMENVTWTCPQGGDGPRYSNI